MSTQAAGQTDDDRDTFTDTDIKEVSVEEDERQFLVWDCESGVWRILDLVRLAKEYELSSYCGYGRPERVLRLFRADLKVPVVVEPHMVRKRTTPDDYEFTTYELRDEQGAVHGRYTVKLDGRV